jgi:hypothetical protein
LTLNLSTKWLILLLEFIRKDCICLYFYLLFNGWRECRWEAATKAIMWSWWVVMNFLSNWFEMTLHWFCTMIYLLATNSTGKNWVLDLVKNLPHTIANQVLYIPYRCRCRLIKCSFFLQVYVYCGTTWCSRILDLVFVRHFS